MHTQNFSFYYTSDNPLPFFLEGGYCIYVSNRLDFEINEKDAALNKLRIRLQGDLTFHPHGYDSCFFDVKCAGILIGSYVAPDLIAKLLHACTKKSTLRYIGRVYSADLISGHICFQLSFYCIPEQEDITVLGCYDLCDINVDEFFHCQLDGDEFLDVYKTCIGENGDFDIVRIAVRSPLGMTLGIIPEPVRIPVDGRDILARTVYISRKHMRIHIELLAVNNCFGENLST